MRTQSKGSFKVPKDESYLKESEQTQERVLGQTRKILSRDEDLERMSDSFHQGRALEKSTSRVLTTVILCMMMIGTHWALPTCYQYPRYFVSLYDSNIILSMDMHFQSDLLVYVGQSQDFYLNRTPLCSWCAIRVVVAMSIAEPTLKWTLSAISWTYKAFSDVNISYDGAKVVVAGPHSDSLTQAIVWVLNAANGSILSQKVLQLLGSGSTSLSLTLRYYNQALIRSSQPVIYLLMRTNSPDTSVYLAKFDYAATSMPILWSLQNNPAQTTQVFSQITYGGSSSITIEDSLYVVVPVGNIYQISRIAEDGTIQWTYKFPLDTSTTVDSNFFIEYALNDISSSDNTLVIATAQYHIAVMQISSTESLAAGGPVASSLILYREPASFGATSAIYVKPSSDLVYLLKKSGSIYYIGSFSTSSLTITYKQAFYSCTSEASFFPRAIFKDENNYFAAVNCAGYLYYSASNIFSIGTSYYGGLLLASDKTLYSSCYSIPTASPVSYTMTDQTASFNIAGSSSGHWQATTASTVVFLANDPQSSFQQLNMAYMTQNTAFCPLAPSQSMYTSSAFINYVSGLPSQFLFSANTALLTCVPGPNSKYTLENYFNSISLNPMSFMSINQLTGTISISASSTPSNFTHSVTARLTSIMSQVFTLYDLRLYFADLKDSAMLSGELMSNKTTWYNQPLNPLTFGTITVNGTSLRAAPYFIQHDSVNKILTLTPTSILHFGVHTLRFIVSASTGLFYEQVIKVSVKNRAPYFATNITNSNYSTTFSNITTFILPLRVSPDLGSPWARVTSNQDFVTTIGQGTDLLMRVNALNFYEDMTQHNVSIEVFIPNYPNTTIYWVNLRIVNTPPKFDTPLVDYDMGLYQNKNFKLPKVIDPDGGPVNVRWGIVTNFNFIKFEPTTCTFMFNPMEANMIGDYNIMVTLTDYHGGTQSEEFTLRVHRPPMFAVKLKQYFSMKVGSMFSIDLPLYQTDGIDTFHSSIPGSFVKFDKFQYTFKPTSIAHLGVFLIKGKLQNIWGTLNFDFRIEVTNEPPTLTMKPKDFVILQDTNFTQTLPAAIDPEGQPITIKMSEASQNSLPSFITYDQITNEYTLAPTRKTKVGIFMIQVDVSDIMNYMNTYKFKIQVLENNLFNKNRIKDKIIEAGPSSKFKRYQAKLLINQVRRDGTATLKIAAGNSMTGQLAIQVTNQTFSMRLVRGDEVRYEVESVDEDKGTIEIHLKFANPSNVSNKFEQDKLEIQVIQHLEFENAQMHLELKAGQIEKKFVPPQLSFGLKAASIFSSGNIKLSDQTAVNFVISMMFQTIWMQLDDTSFMSINSMISMPVPGMVQLVNNVIMSFIYVDIFLSDQWLPVLIYGVERVDDDNEPLNSFFDESGYSSRMLLKNINSSLVLICIYCSIFCLLLIFRILGYYSQWFMLAYEKLRKKLFWSISIQFFDNQFPPLLSASLISLFDFKFETRIHTVSAVMSIVILFVSGILILTMVYHLCKATKNSQLQSEDFTQRLGALTEDQRQGAFAGVYWRPLILLRWTATMLIMTFLRDNYYMQIFTLLGISFAFQVMIAGSRPMLDKLDNHMLLFNEIMVSIYLYLLLCLNDFMDENDQRDYIGFALLFVVVLTVLVNLLKFLIVLDWCFLVRLIKHKFLECKKRAVKSKESNDKDTVPEPSKNGEIIIKKKRKSILFERKHDNFTNLAALNDDQMNKGYEDELSQTGTLEFGGGGQSYNIKLGEKIRQKQRQHVAKIMRDPKTNLLKVESINENKEENIISQVERFDERLEFDQAVEKMMRDIRSQPDLFVKDKKVAVKAKYNDYYDE